MTKIQSKQSNDPIWRDVYSHSKLPEQLTPLYEIASNLWWVWHYEGAKLFREISPDLWKSTEGNPVLLLQELPQGRIEEILTDNELMLKIDYVYKRFRDYMAAAPYTTKPSIAYFSMAYGPTIVLMIHSGGLRVAAADYLQ